MRSSAYATFPIPLALARGIIWPNCLFQLVPGNKEYLRASGLVPYEFESVPGALGVFCGVLWGSLFPEVRNVALACDISCSNANDSCP